jgi:2-phosphoglycerate kinase
MKQPRHTDPLPLGGDGIPYSKGLMARALIATGMPAVRAYELARRIDVDLQDRDSDSVELERVHELAVTLLGEKEADDALRRVRRFEELHSVELPIILLVGGGTGTGKSTLATEVAYRLGISRVTSTDFVRQTMRAFFSREFMPTIHYSSFEAGGVVSGVATDQAIAGFLEQTRNVLVGVGAAMDRALEEGWSMVLEGVHLVPGMLPSAIEDALFVQCVLAVEDEDTHRARFHVRDLGSEGKRAQDRYLERFDEIRAIQEFIVQRAQEHDVAVVENSDPERSIVEVMELVFASVGEAESVRSG